MADIDKITFDNLNVILEDHGTYYRIYNLNYTNSITWACYDRIGWFYRLKEWNTIYKYSFEESVEKIMSFSEISI